MWDFLQNWRVWIWPAGILAAAPLIALLVHAVLFFILGRLAERKGDVFVTSLVRHSKRPCLWIFPFLALLAALPAAKLPDAVLTPLERAAGLGLITATSWFVILFVEIVSDVISAQYRVDVADNLTARSIQTQIQMLHRVVVVVVVVVTISVMLMTFPAIKHIGLSLLASAGLAGLIVGMAMKSTLSSLIAGIQVAFTQPIRLQDVVVVEGQWGWIEEIGTTFVVVRIWDLRRLVVPLSYFLEHPIENWTRKSADLLANVIFYADYTVPTEEIRQELRRILESTELWKGEVCALQVTDATDNALQLRALMDARDSGTAWDLRCYVREKLVQFLQEEYPNALPKARTELYGLPTEQEMSRQPATQSAQARGAGR